MEHLAEVSMKVSSRSDIRNLDFRRTWTFLMDLEMVSDWMEHLAEVSLKITSRFDISNHVKNQPVLQVTSWILGGHGYS